MEQPLFVAHSESDQTADIEGVEELIVRTEDSSVDKQNSEFFRIGKHFNVSHASVVLKEPVFALNGSPLEPANSFFDPMMGAVEKFVSTYLLVEFE